jgi:drug/metabolite transporter (DMT)-like permease
MPTAATLVSDEPNRTRIIASFAAIYLVWGSTFLAIRWAVETIPPFMMMTGRCLLGGGVLVALALIQGRGDPWPTLRELGGAAVAGACFFVGCHGLLAYAERTVPSGMAALCLATIPLFVPLLVWGASLGGPPTARAAGALLVGFAGVAMLVASQGATGGLAATDAALLLFTALSWAVGTVATRVLATPASPAMSGGAALLAGAVLLLPIAAATGEFGEFSVGDVSARSLGGLLYLIIAGTVLTFSSYMWLLTHVSPSRVATYAFVNPAVAVLLGWAIADEHLTAGALVATAVIVVAVAVVVTERRPALAAD